MSCRLPHAFVVVRVCATKCHAESSSLYLMQRGQRALSMHVRQFVMRCLGRDRVIAAYLVSHTVCDYA